LSELRNAALLHDVGLVRASRQGVRDHGYSGGDVARWGAGILGESPGLRPVARLIDRQADPFRRPGSMPDPSLDLRSQIISLACEVDRLRASGMQVGDLVEAVHEESSYRYSPAVVKLVASAIESADLAQHRLRPG
jgi:hypothetical protein